MLKGCLIAKLSSWSGIAFDVTNAMLLIVTIILKRFFKQKCCFLSLNFAPLCDTTFPLDLGRNGSEGKIPRLGNMLGICLGMLISFMLKKQNDCTARLDAVNPRGGMEDLPKSFFGTQMLCPTGFFRAL